MEENPNDAHKPRTLRPSDNPQSREDSVALKLLAVVDGHPRLEIVKIVFHLTSGKGAQEEEEEEFAYLELRTTDIQQGDCSAANLYACIELPLSTILERPVEQLSALLSKRLISLSAITHSAATPPPQMRLMAN